MKQSKKSSPLDDVVYPPFEGFPKEGFKFLRDLKKHNNREWFNKHKPDYEEFVKFPMETLLASLREPVRAMAPEIVIHPKKSMFRIYRDTRFSKNKTPYKTHAAAAISPPGRWQMSGGFYMHVEPGRVFAGGGMYMPDGPQLKKIRSAIASKGKEFLGTVRSAPFKKTYGELMGDRLSRYPQGFKADDPMIEWLKFKHFYSIAEWDEKVAYDARFIRRLTDAFKTMLPLVRFINSAIGKR